MSVNDVDGGIKKNVCGHGMAAAMSRAEGAHAAERADKKKRENKDWKNLQSAT